MRFWNYAILQSSTGFGYITYTNPIISDLDHEVLREHAKLFGWLLTQINKALSGAGDRAKHTSLHFHNIFSHQVFSCGFVWGPHPLAKRSAKCRLGSSSLRFFPSLTKSGWHALTNRLFSLGLWFWVLNFAILSLTLSNNNKLLTVWPTQSTDQRNLLHCSRVDFPNAIYWPTQSTTLQPCRFSQKHRMKYSILFYQVEPTSIELWGSIHHLLQFIGPHGSKSLITKQKIGPHRLTKLPARFKIYNKGCSSLCGWTVYKSFELRPLGRYFTKKRKIQWVQLPLTFVELT